ADEEELTNMQLYPRARNMSFVFRAEPGAFPSFESFQVADTTIRAQRVPFDYDEAAETITLLAPSRTFMEEFIDDFTATLAAETNLPANAIFLKAHFIPFQKPNSTVQDDVGFIPVLKVMVQVGYLPQFNAHWEKTADGTW